MLSQRCHLLLLSQCCVVTSVLSQCVVTRHQCCACSHNRLHEQLEEIDEAAKYFHRYVEQSEAVGVRKTLYKYVQSCFYWYPAVLVKRCAHLHRVILSKNESRSVLYIYAVNASTDMHMMQVKPVKSAPERRSFSNWVKISKVGAPIMFCDLGSTVFTDQTLTSCTDNSINM